MVRVTLWDAFNSTKYKYRVYMFLNRPRTVFAIGYQIGLGLLIATNIILTVFMSRRTVVYSYWAIFGLDLAVTIIFGIEHFVRIWASTCLPKFQGINGFLYMLIHPIYLLDLAVLGTTVTVLAFDVRESLLAVGLRGFRMLHFFENRYHLWRMIGWVIWTNRFQLAVLSYFCLVWLFIIAFLVYFIEAPYNDGFKTVANSLWFTLVTFTTVGYGDVAPLSTPGKIITGIGMIVGVSIFALPGGVIGAGLALKVDEEASSPMNLKMHLAAAMMQNAWRVFLIRKRLLLNPQVVITMTPRMKHLHFSNKPEIGSINPYVALFIYRLRLILSIKKFKYSMYLCDSATFYEAYTTNTMTYNEIIKDMQTQMGRVEDTINSIAARLGEDRPPTEGQIEDVKRKKKRKCKCRSRGAFCWRCLQRRRMRRLAGSGRQPDPE